MDAFEITKPINQMHGVPDNKLTTCLQSCQIPCTGLYGLESLVLFFFLFFYEWHLHWMAFTK